MSVSRSCHFTHAICRRPATDLSKGLRAVDTGTPDAARLTADHADYIAALRSTGAMVTVLDPLEAFPDAVFVEDTALCLPEMAILMRPGAASRMGEVGHMAPTLRAAYDDRLVALEAPARIEGGDVLVTETEVLVGLSARTDMAGVAALKAALAPLPLTLRVVETPPGVLHFKTDCSLLAPDTVLATRRLAASGCFKGYDVIHVPDGEDAAANAIRFNDLVILPAGFPRTANVLDRAGFTVVTVGNTEAAKLDGGMSCLSLRFTPPGG